jgi:hypothetical protein
MKLSQITEDQDLFEMSNIRKSESGLPVNIYVSSGGSVNTRHGPRIKIMTNSGNKFNPHQTVSVMLKRDITDEDVIGYEKVLPGVLNSVKQYVNLNFDVLMAYWNDEIGTYELIQRLKSL